MITSVRKMGAISKTREITIGIRHLLCCKVIPFFICYQCFERKPFVSFDQLSSASNRREISLITIIC